MHNKYMLFYESPKNWGYYVHAQTVCTKPLLRGGGPGDEAGVISSICFPSGIVSCSLGGFVSQLWLQHKTSHRMTGFRPEKPTMFFD